MRANADDIKIVPKFGKDTSLPFGVMQMCAKCACLLYDVVNCCSLNKLLTEKVLKHKHGNLRNIHLQITAFCSKSFDELTSRCFMQCINK